MCLACTAASFLLLSSIKQAPKVPLAMLGDFQWARARFLEGWAIQEFEGGKWLIGNRPDGSMVPHVNHGTLWRIIPGTLRGEAREKPGNWR